MRSNYADIRVYSPLQHAVCHSLHILPNRNRLQLDKFLNCPCVHSNQTIWSDFEFL